MNAPARFAPAAAASVPVAPLRGPSLSHVAAALAEQRRRFAALGPRRPGEHRVHFERAAERLEAAEAAVELALAAPWAGLNQEANRALQMAAWAVTDVADLRFGQRG